MQQALTELNPSLDASLRALHAKPVSLSLFYIGPAYIQFEAAVNSVVKLWYVVCNVIQIASLASCFRLGTIN
jgi:hypothetical protein